MKLKANTEYYIFTTGYRKGWLRIDEIQNVDEDYTVNLHGSETGYWISYKILDIEAE